MPWSDGSNRRRDRGRSGCRSPCRRCRGRGRETAPLVVALPDVVVMQFLNECDVRGLRPPEPSLEILLVGIRLGLGLGWMERIDQLPMGLALGSLPAYGTAEHLSERGSRGGVGLELLGRGADELVGL